MLYLVFGYLKSRLPESLRAAKSKDLGRANKIGVESEGKRVRCVGLEGLGTGAASVRTRA